MEHVAKFGDNHFHRGFGLAVENGLLADYKVIVVDMDEVPANALLRVRRSWTERAPT